MAIEGKVRTLYTDKTQQEAIFPTTKVSAVTDDEGNGLNTLLEHIAYVDPTDMESAAVLANADLLGGYPASDYAFVEDLKNLKPEDIGAAPAGYGLGGGVYLLTSANNLNTIRENGWYSWSSSSKPANTPTGDSTTYLDVMRVTGTGAACIQEVFDVSDSSTCGLKMQRTIYGSSYVSAWEWVNPPMSLGVEYRTTERYEGKPVYTKMINTGSMTNGSHFVYAQDATRPIRCFVTVDNSLLPDYVGGALVGGNWSKWYDISGKTFTAYMGTNFTHIGYRLQIWYIK